MTLLAVFLLGWLSAHPSEPVAAAATLAGAVSTWPIDEPTGFASTLALHARALIDLGRWKDATQALDRGDGAIAGLDAPSAQADLLGARAGLAFQQGTGLEQVRDLRARVLELRRETDGLDSVAALRAAVALHSTAYYSGGDPGPFEMPWRTSGAHSATRIPSSGKPDSRSGPSSV